MIKRHKQYLKKIGSFKSSASSLGVRGVSIAKDSSGSIAVQRGQEILIDCDFSFEKEEVDNNGPMAITILYKKRDKVNLTASLKPSPGAVELVAWLIELVAG